MNVKASRKGEVDEEVLIRMNVRAKILPMAAGKRSEDDRAEAPGWYARLKLHQRMDELGVRAAKIAEDSGVADATISTCMGRGAGVGLLQMVRLAEYLQIDPGRFLDDALAWWEHQGRDHARAVKMALAQGMEPPRKPSPGDAQVPPAALEEARNSTPPPGSVRRESKPPKRRHG